VRYPLPFGAPQTAETDVYGYLLATVSQDGTIQFSFQEVYESDVPLSVRQRYPEALVPWCFAHNSQNKDPIARDITPTCAGAINRHQQRPAALTNGALLPSGFFHCP